MNHLFNMERRNEMLCYKDNQYQISKKDYIVLSIGEYHDDVWKVDRIECCYNYVEIFVTLLKNNPENKRYTFDYPIIYVININKLKLTYCDNYRIYKGEDGKVELILKVYYKDL